MLRHGRCMFRGRPRLWLLPGKRSERPAAGASGRIRSWGTSLRSACVAAAAGNEHWGRRQGTRHQAPGTRDQGPGTGTGDQCTGTRHRTQPREPGTGQPSQITGTVLCTFRRVHFQKGALSEGCTVRRAHCQNGALSEWRILDYLRPGRSITGVGTCMGMVGPSMILSGFLALA